MLIRFNENDPRAGTTARMDSRRGQELIDSGAAVQVAENAAAVTTAAPATSDARAATLLDQNAATVVAAVGKGVDADVLAAALAAERAGKGRKTVLEAIEAALAAN